MACVQFKSPNNGSTLTFTVTSRLEEETNFDVAVKTRLFSGTSESSTYMVLSPSYFFREMAKEWEGWKAAKIWCDLEQRVHIAATTDALGHICLTIKLRTLESDEKLTVKLSFEAGQLEAMSNEIDALFK